MTEFVYIVTGAFINRLQISSILASRRCAFCLNQDFMNWIEIQLPNRESYKRNWSIAFSSRGKDEVIHERLDVKRGGNHFASFNKQFEAIPGQ